MIQFQKTFRSFKYALMGLLWLFKGENNAKVHAVATVIVIAVGVYLNVNSTEWLWIFLSIALVFITEIINTAIEKLVNIISPDYMTEAGKIKDLAAAAVLISAVFALLCAGMIFIPYLSLGHL